MFTTVVVAASELLSLIVTKLFMRGLLAGVNMVGMTLCGSCGYGKKKEKKGGGGGGVQDEGNIEGPIASAHSSSSLTAVAAAAAGGGGGGGVEGASTTPSSMKEKSMWKRITKYSSKICYQCGLVCYNATCLFGVCFQGFWSCTCGRAINACRGKEKVSATSEEDDKEPLLLAEEGKVVAGSSSSSAAAAAAAPSAAAASFLTLSDALQVMRRIKEVKDPFAGGLCSRCGIATLHGNELVEMMINNKNSSCSRSSSSIRLAIADCRDTDAGGGKLLGAVSTPESSDGKPLQAFLQFAAANSSNVLVFYCMESLKRGPRQALRAFATLFEKNWLESCHDAPLLSERERSQRVCNLMPRILILEGGASGFICEHHRDERLVINYDQSFWEARLDAIREGGTGFAREKKKERKAGW